jgi:hypothetical protein
MYKRIVLITSCGKLKEKTPKPAGKLYKSSRIRHLYRRSKELGISFYILSAKYGLVEADQVIEPYDQELDEKRLKELLPQVANILKNFDVVIFYKGGAKKYYLDLIRKACIESNIKLVVFGYKCMGDIKKLDKILEEIRDGRLSD